MQQSMSLGRLVSKGFVFLWIPFEHTLGMVKEMEDMNFKLVESIVWIKKNLNNHPRLERTPYKLSGATGKETVYVFRRRKTKRKFYSLHMMHQRHSDVIEAFVKFDSGT